ncbi:Chaperone DnaK [Gossypium australe]|uniref:Chaperone DnaK n=1 Tax=Gossypium australe TaxID=47621 RepID=A0A5B6W7I2_9ROSI|nr:Chaperone DnaK [Gossypium australe]
MLGFSQSTATSSQKSRGTKKEWVSKEDVVIKTLKKDWAIVYDMLKGKDNSGFGWDEHRINAEDVANERNTEEGSNDNGCEVDVSLDEMDVSARQSHPSNPNKAYSTFSKKKKKSFEVSEPISSTLLIDAVRLLGDNIRTIGLELSRSIAFEMLIQEKVQTLSICL